MFAPAQGNGPVNLTKLWTPDPRRGRAAGRDRPARPSALARLPHGDAGRAGQPDHDRARPPQHRDQPEIRPLGEEAASRSPRRPHPSRLPASLLSTGESRAKVVKIEGRPVMTDEPDRLDRESTSTGSPICLRGYCYGPADMRRRLGVTRRLLREDMLPKSRSRLSGREARDDRRRRASDRSLLPPSAAASGSPPMSSRWLSNGRR